MRCTTDRRHYTNSRNRCGALGKGHGLLKMCGRGSGGGGFMMLDGGQPAMGEKSRSVRSHQRKRNLAQRESMRDNCRRERRWNTKGSVPDERTKRELSKSGFLDSVYHFQHHGDRTAPPPRRRSCPKCPTHSLLFFPFFGGGGGGLLQLFSVRLLQTCQYIV